VEQKKQLMMMKKISIYFLIFSLIPLCNNFAQQLYFSGIITFERKENIHKQFTGTSAWEDELKDKIPKYRTDEFTLTFNKAQSLYKLSKEEKNAFANWWRVAADNTVFNNLSEHKTINIKEIYDETYVIEDSIPQLKWKYHGDIRKIAGYNCRKASTIINDSLYIIAFYTDEIPVASGPESFTGLPGMILGFVAPRLNITCFATNFTPKQLSESDLTLKKPKGKTASFSSFIKNILSATNDWGEYASKIYFKSLL